MCLKFFSILIKFEFSGQIFIEVLNIQLHGDPPMEFALVYFPGRTYGMTERQMKGRTDLTKQIGSFRDLV